MRCILIISLIFLSNSIFADPKGFIRIKKTYDGYRSYINIEAKKHIGSRGINLKGIRYKNDDRPAVIFFPGLWMDITVMRPLAYQLFSVGYDVWIVGARGQGKGSNRSTVEGNKSYHFSDMIGDVHLTINTVYDYINKSKSTKRKVYIGGHSLGGVLTGLAATGATVDKFGRGVYSEQAKLNIHQKVAGVLLLGALKDRNKVYGDANSLKITDKLFNIIGKLNVRIPSNSVQGEYYDGIWKDSNSSTEGVIPRYLNPLCNTQFLWIPKFLRGDVCLTGQDILLMWATAAVEPHLAADMGFWAQEHEMKTRDGVSWTFGPKIEKVAVLKVAAEYDLVNLDNMNLWTDNSYNQIVESSFIKKAGHMSLVYGVTVSEVTKSILNFIQKVENN